MNGGFPEHYFDRSTRPESFVPSLDQQPLPAWASDFQKLNINDVGSSPLPSSSFRHEAPLQRTVQGDWHQEWQAKQAQKGQGGSGGVRLPTSLAQAQSTFRGMGWQQHPHLGSRFGVPVPGTQLSPIAQQKQAEQNGETMFNEEAFERAFEAATLEVSKSEAEFVRQAPQNGHATVDVSSHSKVSNTTDFDFDAFLRNRDEEAMEDFNVHDPLHNAHQNLLDDFDFDSFLSGYPPDFGLHDKLSSKTARMDHQPEQQRGNLSSNQDADELSRTAGELLEKVQYEQNHKFRESKFLALMRQLRDKEVRVEGDRMVDVSNPPNPPETGHNHLGPAELITCRVMQCAVQDG